MPLSVGLGNYSTPVSGSTANRTGVAVCTPGTYCLSGVQYTWYAGVAKCVLVDIRVCALVELRWG